MRKWITSVKGEYVAFTGTAWRKRRELQNRVRRLGGEPTPRGAVNSNTTVLVRGKWEPNNYGSKEEHAAQLIRTGQEIAVVSDSEFRKLLEAGRPAKVLDTVAGQPLDWLIAPTKTQFETAARISGPLDYEHSVLGRLEQGFLRNRLFGGTEEALCALCGRKLPISLMVAAHIKPRSECSSRERRDADNIVFGVCLLGCDALYERGLISVSRAGTVQTASVRPSASLRSMLVLYRGKTCPAWTHSNAEYFKWHFERRFQS